MESAIAASKADESFQRLHQAAWLGLNVFLIIHGGICGEKSAPASTKALIAEA